MASKNTGRPKGSKSVAPEDFIRAWQSSESMAEAAKKCGLSSNRIASTKASLLRRCGIELKVMRERGTNDYKALARLAKEYAK